MLKRALAFEPMQTTILVVVVYAAVFLSVLVTNGTQSIPQDTRGLDLEQGYKDLHQITARPHPFNSHENDRVHAYILSRLLNITTDHTFAHVVEDTVSNASWTAVALHGVHFEGNNILVKIDGTDATLRGVLFSAHLDSVSTAPGTTDDGIGIVTMIQFVQYLMEQRPRRTAIFNFNNGEEDGLNGAHVFLEHPWSRITQTFLNLEGAGAGGRPTLFRTTSSAPLHSFRNVPHPHGNVVSADAFARGVVRSGTDFSVYAKSLGKGKPMEGLDFAFFQGRSKYHTKHDSIPGANGVKESLWSMMESVRAAGLSLLNDEDGYVGKREPPVYFDLFGFYFVVHTQGQLFRLNVSLLLVGQLIVLFLHGFPFGRTPATKRKKDTKKDDRPNTSWPVVFWATLIFTGLLQFALTLSVVKINPYIFYSQPYAFVASSLSLAYLTITLSMQVALPSEDPQYSTGQRQEMLVQTYYFTWLLLLASTVVLSKWKIGVVYVVSGWNACVLLGVTFNLSKEATEGREQTQLTGTSSEHGPLMSPPKTPEQNRGTPPEKVGRSSCWIAQLFLVVPLPISLFVHLLVLLVASLSQTLSDGNNPVVVYGAASVLSVLLAIPSLPFSVKFHQWITLLVFVVFAISTIHIWTAFPFSQDAPLKTFFQQELVVDFGKSNDQAVRAITKLIGIPEYLEQTIVPQLPSSWDAGVQCTPEPSRPGLIACRWESKLLPYPGGVDTTPSTPWLLVNTTRLTPSSALVSVKGTNTRTCKLYFDSANITRYDVYELGENDAVSPSNVGMQHGYEVPKGGLDSIWLWSRTWDRNFTVEIEWEDYSGDFEGRVGCEWAEYESGMIGGESDVSHRGQIPAFEEVLSFLPQWATVSKTADGLVEAWGRFVV
ncbi:hypothetical protein BDZ94DRAFT_1350181 [Collybia nuda]|uniref:Peptide hydrolase n=1 Tax=Collybia nuda TaxID=64659 RepID=A0A9P6CGG3_9AGAR|nr:hypothetical protein BDZ94DRAFT_1350181 [Collybia nuda]